MKVLLYSRDWLLVVVIHSTSFLNIVDLSRLFVPFNIFSSCIKQHSEILNNINQIIDYVNINYCNLCARKIQVCTHAHESRVDQSKHLTHRWIQFKKASVKRFCVLLALMYPLSFTQLISLHINSLLCWLEVA